MLQIQKMLHYCSDHLDGEKEDDAFQAFAVLGIAVIAMGEEIGAEMALRSLNHLVCFFLVFKFTSQMHYGELVTRRVVPLAFGLLCVSNPVVQVMDVLSKYSHDHDTGVAQSAIFAMGLIGAGTNNARLAQMLRQLAAYYHKEPNCLFVVRLAQVFFYYFFYYSFQGINSYGQRNSHVKSILFKSKFNESSCCGGIVDDTCCLY